jgi:hypothetical protein
VLKSSAVIFLVNTEVEWKSLFPKKLESEYFFQAFSGADCP